MSEVAIPQPGSRSPPAWRASRTGFAAFDVATGEPTRAPCVAAIATCHVTVGENGAIEVELPD